MKLTDRLTPESDKANLDGNKFANLGDDYANLLCLSRLLEQRLACAVEYLESIRDDDGACQHSRESAREALTEIKDSRNE